MFFTKTVEKIIEKPVGDPTLVVEQVLGRGIEWFDYNELSQSDLQAYYQNAQLILKNPVFTNEVSRIVADCMKWALREAKDFDSVRDMRMNINGIELLKERLGAIPNPLKVVNEEDLHSAI